MIRFIYWLCLAVVLLPLTTVFISLIGGDIALLKHLASTVLTDYAITSLLLALGVGIGAATIGTAMAWVLSRYQFCGSRWLSWLAVLPLAVPAYIIAYTYTGMLDFSGPIQTALRSTFEWQYGDYWFPNVRSLGGAIVMLTLVLFPYVYLLARNAFAAQPLSMREAAASMGVAQSRYFFTVALPMARPAIIAGMALVMMEALADYGTVAYFGVSTFTTGIFRTWFGMGSRQTALQLAAMLMLVVFVFLILEQRSRQKLVTATLGKAPQPTPVRGIKALALIFLCALPVLFGFIIPVIQLGYWAVSYLNEWQWQDYMPLITQSLYLAAVAAVATVIVALFMSYSVRWYRNTSPQWGLNLAKLGYALPGVVVAVGLLSPFGAIDHGLNALTLRWFDWQPGLVMSGTLFVLCLAYVVRFLAVAIQHTQNGLLSITPNMDDAARSMGLSATATLRKVHIPIMRSSVLAAALLVFVDVLKELPATLVLRPFNVNTLAVKAYELAMDERLQQAALPALTIVLCGVLPVILLIKQLQKHEARHAESV